jgi:tetratricopeptide (TPR) repeat protein
MVSSRTRFRAPGRFLRAAILLATPCLTPAVRSLAADTIVLKNGRRIPATSAVEAGEKVTYQTSAGELSLPLSIVDHIEKGGASFLQETAGHAATKLAITPPAIESNAAIEKGTVRDGSVDRAYLAKLDGEAHSGLPAGDALAALAHHTAAQFELSHGDMESALADERTGLTFAPSSPAMLMNVAYLHLLRSEYKAALEYLEHARSLAPGNPDVPKMEGWALYGLNKLDQAVTEWKRSLALRQDPEVQNALDKALRDRDEEQNYRENESSHFMLRYSGEAQPELAHEIMHALETHFSAIESELNFTPPDPIGVILYTQQAFADITRAPGWVGALNDGRIRVPVQGLTSLTPELSRVLKHELTHSFIQQKTHGRAPTWMQEGIAQWMEGKRSSENSSALIQIYDQKTAKPLNQLEGTWMGLPADVASYAYAWALANVEYLIQADGMGDIERILNRIAAGDSTEAGLSEVLHSDYEDLMQSTVNYLRKTYIR